MTREQKYDAVNSCESFLGLANTIRSFADDNGMIQGRTREFDAERMAHAAENYPNVMTNSLTREFGIRQQAMYIQYYGSRERTCPQVNHGEGKGKD